MKYSPKYALQAGGDVRQWSNPERTFWAPDLAALIAYLRSLAPLPNEAK